MYHEQKLAAEILAVMDLWRRADGTDGEVCIGRTLDECMNRITDGYRHGELSYEGAKRLLDEASRRAGLSRDL